MKNICPNILDNIPKNRYFVSYVFNVLNYFHHYTPCFTKKAKKMTLMCDARKKNTIFAECNNIVLIIEQTNGLKVND